MLTILIPSFDRPMQLECLLNSLDLEDDFKVKVLYKWSDKKYLEGYEKVAAYYTHVGWLEEKNFCENWKSLLSNSSEYVMLATDDCVQFYPFDNEVDLLFSNDVHCISLRLGENTIIQDYILGLRQPALDNYGDVSECFDMLKWNFKRHPRFNNYGYAFSLDMTIYRQEDLIKYTKDLTFESPRALEHQLNTLVDRDSLPKFMLCPKRSLAFVNTINCVQANGPPAGTKHNYSPSLLNEKFLAGERISLKSFLDFHNNIISSHEEVPLIFEALK